MTKKPATKSTAKRTTSKKVAPKRVSRAQKNEKVDYYPNRMTVATAVLAGTILVLVAVIAVLGSRG
jgi:hypothetical protein